MVVKKMVNTILATGIVAAAVARVTTFPALAQNECRLTFTGYEGTETLRDFPALIKIPDGLTGFDYKDSTTDGSDLVFFGADGQAPEVRAAAWVAAEFRRPVKITGYAWSTADDLSERDPSSWRLQGSNDGKTWTDIHVVRGFFATGMRNARAFAK